MTYRTATRSRSAQDPYDGEPAGSQPDAEPRNDSADAAGPAAQGQGAPGAESTSLAGRGLGTPDAHGAPSVRGWESADPAAQGRGVARVANVRDAHDGPGARHAGNFGQAEPSQGVTGARGGLSARDARGSRTAGGAVSVSEGVTATLAGRFVVRTREIPDPGDLLARLPDPAPLIWLRRGEGLVGWGEAARVVLPGDDDRDGLARRWYDAIVAAADVDDPLRLPGTGLVAFGSLTFDRRSGGSVLVVPRVVLGRRAGRAWLTTVGDVRTPAGILGGERIPTRTPTVLDWHDGTLSAAEWQRRVAAAVAQMRAGAYDKVVLARDLYARTAGPIDARVVASRLAERFPDCYTYACDGLVGATPELLIRRIGRRIESLVLAGSAPRGADDAEDARLGAELLDSAKNVEEHRYAAESARASLAPLCASVTGDDVPNLLKLANIQHLATRLGGELSGDLTSLDVAAALHPTAAVGGTPTGVAVQAIRELEGMDRGRYAGPVGWVDGRGNGEWGIALRCAQLSGDGAQLSGDGSTDGPGARLFAGCGIVAGSDPAAELAEAQVKFQSVRSALA